MLLPLSNPIVRNRILAVLLGITLGAGIIAALKVWPYAYEHGREMCARCHATRKVDRYGPFWFRSTPSVPASAVVCDEHDWRRVGCWTSGHGVSCYRSGGISLP
jgi:hypothetical protein